MATEGSLWMGSLEQYMNENFIWNAFKKMGYEVLNVNIKCNKIVCLRARYGFVRFKDDPTALAAMHELKNQFIPGSYPPVRFVLNHPCLHRRNYHKNNFSVRVGELSPDVNEFTLFKGFACRFPSVVRAKIILDPNGFSKGYGYVRFAKKEEQKFAVDRMNGFVGIGGKALSVTIVVNPRQMKRNPWTLETGQTTTTPQLEHNQYFEENWQKNHPSEKFGYYHNPMYSQAQQQPCNQQQDGDYE